MTKDELTIDSTMQQVLDVLPGGKRALFSKYHLGGCQSCAFGVSETLAGLATRSGVEPREMLGFLLESDAHDSAMWLGPAQAAAEKKKFWWIDLRTREEHDAVKIEPSEFYTQELQQRIFSGAPETPILLYDHQGKNVLDQVAWFRGHGLVNTFALRGGIDAWSREIDGSLPRYRLEIGG